MTEWLTPRPNGGEMSCGPVTCGDRPVFSVVIPAYNDARHIGEALDSVFSQPIRYPFEVIVVDDGSTDDTQAVLRAAPGPVRVLTKPNGGPGSARNAGALAARSGILAFLDADDRAIGERFDLQVGYMLANPEVAVTFGNCMVERECDDYLGRFGLEASPDRFAALRDPLDRLATVGNFIMMSTAAVRRGVYVDIGMQCEQRRYAEDLAFWCAVAAAGYPFAYVTRPLAWYRTDCHGRLTRSHHTFAGLAYTLHEVLRRDGDRLAPWARRLARDRLTRAADALLRHLWSSATRAEVISALDTFGPAVPPGLHRKWRALSLIPSIVPRAARRAWRMRS